MTGVAAGIGVVFDRVGRYEGLRLKESATLVLPSLYSYVKLQRCRCSLQQVCRLDDVG